MLSVAAILKGASTVLAIRQGVQRPGYKLHVQYGRLFKVLKTRMASGGLPGSGIWTFFHEKPGRQPVQIQCLTFDPAYLKLVPPESR